MTAGFGVTPEILDREKRLRAQAMTEDAWQALVVDFAVLHGWWTYHTHDSRRSQSGWPDLMLIRAPELIIAELKTDPGKLTPAQTAVIASLRACGIEAPVWRPADEMAVFARLGVRPKVAA